MCKNNCNCISDILKVIYLLQKNADREEDPDGALIYGSDYDTLADEFARSLGISRNYEDYEIYCFRHYFNSLHRVC